MNGVESETPEVRQEVRLLFCRIADQPNEHEEQQKLERGRNSLAESAGIPAASEGVIYPN